MVLLRHVRALYKLKMRPHTDYRIADEPVISSVKQHEVRREPGTTTTGDDPGVVCSSRMLSARMAAISGTLVCHI